MQAISTNKPGQQKLLPPTNVTPKPVEGNPMNSLKSQIETLVRNAQKGIPPETMAQTVIAMTPPERIADLQNFVGAHDAVSRMAAVVPTVNAVRPWFDSLRAHILNALQGDTAETTTGLQEESGEDNLADTAPEESTE
jgi:hypothetical protein